jgi:hypothetical protein
VCRKSVPDEMPMKITVNFDLLYPVMTEKGWIPEEVFDELGVPRDMDANGKEALRNAEVSQESINNQSVLHMSINANCT